MFTEVFGDSPRVKLLDFLMDHLDFDYTITQLHEFTRISRPTLYQLTEELRKEKMLVLTREVGGSSFFRVNTDHPNVAWLLRAEFEEINKALGAGQFAESPTVASARSRWTPSKPGTVPAQLVSRATAERARATVISRVKKKRRSPV